MVHFVLIDTPRQTFSTGTKAQGFQIYLTFCQRSSVRLLCRKCIIIFATPLDVPCMVSRV